eukprot:TRINITY_DN29319_c0_g1_i1.p1 TRINITY_DN29319_c0_g1~~TRINITY_DN29319_c0_g1_i1.p1  ORF type:complete len:567 (-),score=117.62 TRINITY_DN29319_c0_g1_i1:125-1750(-)
MALSTAEKTSLLQLAAARENLVFDDAGSAVEIRTEKGLDAAESFLQALEAFAESLQLQPASRAYRSDFKEHFLEVRETRDYSVIILEACVSLSRSRAIWANGRKYVLSREAEEACLSLLEEWSSFLQELEGLMQISRRCDYCTCLDRLDKAWANFEHCYIVEIVKVQDSAKGLVSMAVGVENALSDLEQGCDDTAELADWSDYQLKISSLVECVARLNVAANLQRKTHSELSVDILHSAVELLKVCNNDPHSPLQAARVIAENVVESFEEIRNYLYRVQHCLDGLNPHLCQNACLVERLVRWEETWIIGGCYLQTRSFLHAVCKFVPEMCQVQRLAPAFAQMCADFDAELFLIVPRLLLLFFFADQSVFMDLVASLLPHRFVHAPVLREAFHRTAVESQAQHLQRSRSEPSLPSVRILSSDLAVLGTGSQLQALQKRFHEVRHRLQNAMRAASPETASPEDVELIAWQALLFRAVSGTSGIEGPFDVLMQEHREATVEAVDSFMHELEGWSMELQRHNAEDWNECVNVLVQCLRASEARSC